MVELRVTILEHLPDRLVNSPEHLEATLRDACAGARIAGKLNIITLYAPNRDHLSLVVGGEETVVGFNYGHGDPPYFVSAGTTEAVDPVLTAFVGLEHHTEFPRRWVVPFDVGQRVAREFLASGSRPSSIKWVEL